MPQHDELIDLFIDFYRDYYRDDIGRLAQSYPEERSLYIDYNDLEEYNPELAEDYLSKPAQMQEYAEEALRLYDLPADIQLGGAHVRITNASDPVEIRDVTSSRNDFGCLVSLQGIVKNTSEIRPQVTEAAFECQRCGTMSYIPQMGEGFEEPHECQGCERQGPFNLHHDQSEFVDRQEFLLLEDPDILDKGRTPDSINLRIEDDLCGKATSGNKVNVTGVLRIEQEEEENVFDYYVEGVSIQAVETGETEASSTIESALIPDLETFTELAAEAVSTLPEEAREEETKAKLITPFVEALGWNKYDSTEVRMEHTDSKTRTRPDYALFGPDSDQPDVIVEAKQVNTLLTEKENQIYDYLRVFSAEWGVLTNGKEFRIYQYTGEGNLPHHLATMEIKDLPEADILDSLRREQFYG